MSIQIIGVDCATVPGKVGLANSIYENQELALIEVQVGSKKQTVAESIASWLMPDLNSLITIDAPLGWPQLMGDELASHQAGYPIHQESNNFFRRATDKFIKRKVGKQPLDVGADRIARTAMAALVILKELRDITNCPIPLAWNQEITGLNTIEVYPAGTLRSYKLPDTGYKSNNPEHRQRRAEILDQLSRYMTIKDTTLLLANADVLDASLCCLAGADFVRGKTMQPENQELAKKEGWIWIKDM